MGAFVELSVAVWFATGGIVASLVRSLSKSQEGDNEAVLPRDMSMLSLVGGGLIAGEALWALMAGVVGLLLLMR
jgi:hypothetical protein